MRPRNIAATCLLIVSTFASAADAPRTIVPVFRLDFEREDSLRTLIFTDYHSSVGQELIGIANRCLRSAPDVNGTVRTTGKTRFVLRPAAGGPPVFTPVTLPTVTSQPYPDPNNPNNQCQGSNHTEFDEGDFPNTEFFGCPRDPGDEPYQGPSFDPNGELCEAGVSSGHFNLGIGTGGSATKYLIFSDAVTGTYRNAATGGQEVDFSTFGIHVYLMNGTRVWAKNFPGVDSSGRFEPVLAGVGDFLNDDGEDELRIARIGEGEESQTFRYYYYDLDTGVQVGYATVPVANP